MAARTPIGSRPPPPPRYRLSHRLSPTPFPDAASPRVGNYATQDTPRRSRESSRRAGAGQGRGGRAGSGEGARRGAGPPCAGNETARAAEGPGRALPWPETVRSWAPWRPRRRRLPLLLRLRRRRRRRRCWILAGFPRRRKGSWKTAKSATMTTTASGPVAAAAVVAASPAAASSAAGPTRGAGRLPASAGASPSPPPLPPPPPAGPSPARGTSPRRRWGTCTATAGIGPRTRSAPTRRPCRRRGCRRVRIPRRAPGSHFGNAVTVPWIDSASEAGPTGEEGAGVGAEAAAIGEATLRGGRPEGEEAPDSVAARAGGSPRLENVSLRREREGRAGRPCCWGGPGGVGAESPGKGRFSFPSR